jgi:4-hydroxybenzoate polyprenyltransferase
MAAKDRIATDFGVEIPPPLVEYGPSRISPTRYRMLLETMRPRQWTKNAFVLAGLVFSGRALELEAEVLAWLTLAAFCAMSSAAYLVNDVRDRYTDRLNPRTARRPIARGDIGPRTALTAAAVLATGALVVAALINWQTFAVLAGYGAVQLAYSQWLKHILFIDVMTIATGFLLRALAGLVAIDAELSPWLLLATGLLALFIGLAKRRGEVLAMGDQPPAQRPVLQHYSIALLDELIAVVTPSVLMVYALYGVLGAPSDAMLLTLPFVLYGIFRVLYLIHHKSRVTEDPSTLALRDKPLLACILLWGVTAAIITVAAY